MLPSSRVNRMTILTKDRWDAECSVKQKIVKASISFSLFKKMLLLTVPNMCDMSIGS